MDVVGLPEFLRCMRSAITTDADGKDVDLFLQRLSTNDGAAEMRNARLQLPGTEIELWATGTIRLSGGMYRITWRYEDSDGHRVIVCFTLPQV